MRCTLPHARAGVVRRGTGSAQLATVQAPLAAPPVCGVRCQAAGAETVGSVEATPITVSERALAHLNRMKADKGDSDLLLRIGVRSGGCSGLSYVMDFEASGNVKEDDAVMEYNGFNLVCDPKSLLYLFGMQLDYSDALVGGGFQFHNPNAEDTCGCGKSFGV